MAASSADEGRRVLRQGRPDIVLCDIAMPDEDGYMFVRTLRAHEQRESHPGNKRLPCAALTAHVSAEDRLQSMQAGFDAHLTKPIDPAVLVSAIASFVSPRASSTTA